MLASKSCGAPLLSFESTGPVGRESRLDYPEGPRDRTSQVRSWSIPHSCLSDAHVPGEVRRFKAAQRGRSCSAALNFSRQVITHTRRSSRFDRRLIASKLQEWMPWPIALTDGIVGVSCIWLVFVCSGDERFRWTVCQGRRYGPSRRSYPPRTLLRTNAWMGFVDTTANRQQYFDFRKRISQTNFQTAGVSVDALTSQIQSCGKGDSSGTWSAGSTDRRIVVFPLTRGKNSIRLSSTNTALA